MIFVLYIVITILSFLVLDILINYNSKIDEFIIKATLFLVILISAYYFINWLVIEPLSELKENLNKCKDGLLIKRNQKSNFHREIETIIDDIQELATFIQHIEEDLITRLRFFENLFKTMKMAVVALDNEMKVIYYNPFAEYVFGYRREEIIGKTVMELHSREKVSEEKFQNAINLVKTQGYYKYTIKRQIEDKLLYFESTVFAIYDEKKQIEGYVLTNEDVSDKERHNKRLYLQYEINKILVEALDMESALREVLRLICDNMWWEYGEIYLVDRQSSYLKYDLKYNLNETSTYSHKGLDKGNIGDLMSGIVLDIEGRQGKIGLMTFSSKVLYNFDESLKKTLETICKITGFFIERQMALKIAIGRAVSGFL